MSVLDNIIIVKTQYYCYSDLPSNIPTSSVHMSLPSSVNDTEHCVQLLYTVHWPVVCHRVLQLVMLRAIMLKSHIKGEEAEVGRNRGKKACFYSTTMPPLN